MRASANRSHAATEEAFAEARGGVPHPEQAKQKPKGQFVLSILWVPLATVNALLADETWLVVMWAGLGLLWLGMGFLAGRKLLTERKKNRATTKEELNQIG